MKLGNEELLRILEFCFVSGNQHYLRLVNKQLARLALPPDPADPGYMLSE
jgi:hypothetical protein